MDTWLSGPDLREQLLDEVIAAYFDDVALGREPRREELFARWPDLAGDLAAFFADRDRLDRLAAPLRQTSRAGGPRQAPLQPDGGAACTGLPSQAAETPATVTLGGMPTAEVPAAPVVAGYEVLGELGRGGMGVVYKARQTSLKRLVALKVMRAGPGAEADERARFRAEAEAVARLKHPNIVQIHEIGEHGGLPFFCLEFVDGGNLHARLSGATLPPGAAASVVQTLARAIHFAHEAGIVHRDLKPANVLLAGTADMPVEQCVPKVTDFGLAKRLDSELGQTATGAIVGTPSYMAPEQASGQNREVGLLTDVWALGAILYECLTGHPPFKAATTFDTVLQVLNQEPVPPRRLQPSCPRDVETICLKCLQKEPHRRYTSALELAEDLRRFQAGEPIQARPAGAWERGVKWARRRPAIAALVAVSSLALLGLAGMVVGYHFHLEASLVKAVDGEKQSQEEAREANRKREEVEKAQRLGTLRAEWQPLLEQARAALMPEGLDRKDFATAEKLALKVQTGTRDEPSLSDLRSTAERLLEEVNRLRADLDRFRRLFRARNEALFYLNRQMFTGMDAADLAAAREAAGKGLALFGLAGDEPRGLALDDCYSYREKEKITQGCYELLLLLAEATARPADPQALRQALQILERADRLVPSAQATPRRRARYLTDLRDTARADRERRRAEAQRPASPLDSFLVGREKWEEGNLKEALPHFERALRGEPDLLWARFFLAVGHLKLQQLAEAKAELTVCINQQPDFVWGYVFRGFLQGRLGAFEAAEADFDRAGQLSSDKEVRYVLLVNRGVMRMEQKRDSAAVADLERAVALYPKQFHARLNLALAYQKQKKWKAALDQLDEAVRLRPDLALLYRERAQLHRQRDDKTAALQDFEQALRVEQRGPWAHKDHLERGWLLYLLERYEDADQAAAEALKLRPDYLPAHRLRAEALLLQKSYDEAVRSFDRYLRQAPLVVRALQGRALAVTALGNYAAAVEDYTRALALPPDADPLRTGRSAAPATLRTARGWCYLALEAWPLARRDFEEAVRLDPNSGDAHNGLGFARARLGDHVGAARSARTALRLGPKTSRMLYNSARVFAQAVAAVETQRGSWTRDREETAASYRDEALACLAAALNRLPEDEREGFWRKVVVPDLGAALAPIRKSQGFARLATQYHKPTQ